MYYTGDGFLITINKPLQWRYNGRDGVSNHQAHHCLLNRLLRRRSKKASKLRVIGLCAGNSSVTGKFPAQMAINADFLFHLMTSSWTAAQTIDCPVESDASYPIKRCCYGWLFSTPGVSAKSPWSRIATFSGISTANNVLVYHESLMRYYCDTVTTTLPHKLEYIEHKVCGVISGVAKQWGKWRLKYHSSDHDSIYILSYLLHDIMNL